jgi:phage terminase small subunit
MTTTPNDKQQRFIDEYVIDQNATQAYKRAGYKVKSDHAAAVASSRLLLVPLVRAAVDDRLAVLAKATRMTAEKCWAEVACIARSSIKNFLDVTGPNPKMLPANEIPEEAWKSLKSVKVKRYLEGAGLDAREVEVIEYTLWPKLEANVVVLGSLGELKERVEITGAKGGDFRIEFIEFADTPARPGREPAPAT